MTLIERFLDKTRRAENGCLEWTACRYAGAYSYGKLGMGGRTVRAHRLAYELAHGPIPPGLFVLHKCDNPTCVEADHLFLGTAADNSADMVAKGRQAERARHGSRTHPERLPRGDQHVLHMHPERAARGGAVGSARLDEAGVIEIRALACAGATHRELAAAYGVSQTTISRAVRREAWAHVDEDARLNAAVEADARAGV